MLFTWRVIWLRTTDLGVLAGSFFKIHHRVTACASTCLPTLLSSQAANASRIMFTVGETCSACFHWGASGGWNNKRSAARDQRSPQTAPSSALVRTERTCTFPLLLACNRWSELRMCDAARAAGAVCLINDITQPTTGNYQHRIAAWIKWLQVIVMKSSWQFKQILWLSHSENNNGTTSHQSNKSDNTNYYCSLLLSYYCYYVSKLNHVFWSGNI